MEITNLTKTKIDTSFLQKAARAAFAVLRKEKKSKNSSPPQTCPVRYFSSNGVERGKRGGVEKDYHLLTPTLSSSEEREQNRISLVLVADKKIKELNKKYRGKNKVTDVLSFEELNEIYISLSQAKRQAKLLKTSLKLELMRLLVHGIVHLNGYDHERGVKQAARMLAAENQILGKL